MSLIDFRSKTILVTGGTGSFGNRVASYLETFSPKCIKIFSRDEKKQHEMRLAKPQYNYLIGDIRDLQQIHRCLKDVDIVFHASALKQVPSCEEFPFEAVKTNILGSQNLCEAAIKAGVERVVALSTDKAVKPINAMGISKAMMEKIVTSQNQFQHDTIFCCVRYGNVMGSRGSVIPLFQNQIRNGSRLTVTNGAMTRFLMTLDQSVQLVHHAITEAKGGEVFVKKAPASTVEDLAKAMLSKYGDGDFGRILEVGSRPGEKLDEVLVNEYELQRATELPQFFCIPPEYRPGTASSKYPDGTEYTSANTEQLTSIEDIGHLLDKMGEVDYYK